MFSRLTFALLLAATLVSPCFGDEGRPVSRPATSATTATTRSAFVRVAAIGGINDLGFWTALCSRFEKSSGIHVETVITGNKDGIAALFRKGGIDLITIQSPDTVMNLVAGGYAVDAQPWMQSDLILVGPANDPAGVRGMSDAASAIQKIVESKSPLLIHGNSGADDIVRGILETSKAEPDSDHMTILLDDHQRRVLQAAADKEAYTLISRVPFRSGKLSNDSLVVMVDGDPALRRPYIVAVANPLKMTDAHLGEARKLAAFLRSPQTQAWIAEFGKGKFDDRSFFFPVFIGSPATQPAAGAALTISGDVSKPYSLDLAAIAALPHKMVHTKDHEGKAVDYEGVPLRPLLQYAGVPLGNHQMRGENLALSLLVEARDGYKAIFALPELDDDFAERSIILADRRDGHPLDAGEGPLRIIVPDESRPARWVRQVIELRILKN